MTDKYIHEKKHDVVIIVGEPGVGKSSMILGMYDDYEKKYAKKWKSIGSLIQPRGFIHDLSGSRAFKHIPELSQIQKQYNLKVDHPMDIIGLKDKNSPNGYLWKSGLVRYECNNENEFEYMYRVLMTHLENSFVFLDECTNYIDANPKKWQIIPVTNRRNFGWELVKAYHGLQDVPKKFSKRGHITKMIIFKTDEGELTDAEFKSRWSRWKKVKEAYYKMEKSKPIKDRIQNHIKLVFK